MSKQRQSVKQVNKNESQSSDEDGFEYLLSSLSVDDGNKDAKMKGVDVSQAAPIETSEEFFINNVEDESTDPNRWQVSLETCGTAVTYVLDSGAQVNVLPERVYNSLVKKPRLIPTKARLTAYDGGKIPVKGKCITHVAKGSNKTVPVQFFVVKTQSSPIIGLKTCEQLNLIKRVYKLNAGYDDVLQQYDAIFGDLGCLPGEYHIHVDPTVKPVVHAARRVPFALRTKLKAELDRMASLDVIEKVEKPTDWVNSIVIVEKANGDIRICLDPKDLNRAIKREFSQMPTTEEITSRMSGAKIFSKLDASAGYWQMKLDESSSDLLAFNTPFGRYKFKRLPFGVHCASEIFSKRISELVSGLEGVAHIQDDIIVWGDEQEQHDCRLKSVLDRVQSSGLKLNRSKCVFGVNEIKYVGHIFSHQGLRADPSKIEAIINMPVPQNTSDVHRFLGMITYLGKFIPNLSSKTSELRKLLQKDQKWEWNQKHLDQFRSLQQCITSSPVLKYFDPALPIKLSVDASKDGLGAVLLQLHADQWCPVAYASRALNKAEQNYSQIEKETLAIVFGAEHFNQYVYGVKLMVESDHKPLQSIFQRNINQAPPRIQRMLLRLQKYDITLQFTPGKEIPVADTLSRAYLPTTTDSKFDYQVHLLMNNLPVSESKLDEIRKATAEDNVLQKLKEFIQRGWPESKKSIQADVAPYFQFRADLTVIHDLIFKGERLVIPSTLRQEMKIKLHQGHPGIEKCRARARQVMFWPGINAELTELVSNCSACLENQQSYKREPLIHHEAPSDPWQKVGMDLFYFKGKNYIVVIDYYSNYPEVCLLRDTHSETVISHIKSIFARFGIPNVVVSDNGPQFSSSLFKKFANDWDFHHVTSSPNHPRSNGMAESAVKVIKRLFKKTSQANEDLYLALLAYRSTPNTNDKQSPAEKLFGRPTRTNLPDLRSLVDPNPIKENYLPAKFHPRHMERIKRNHDRSSRLLPGIPIGSTVRIQENKSWPVKAKVVGRSSTPRSYVVETEMGTTRRRNRRKLMMTNERFERVPTELENENFGPKPADISDAPGLENEPTSPEDVIMEKSYRSRLRTTTRPPIRYGIDE